MTAVAHTTDTLAADLERLGLALGDRVLLRAAVRAIGPTEQRGADALIDAAIRVIGPTGTLIGLSFSPVIFRFRRAGSPVFRADAPVITGGFAAAMLRREGAVRSRHPTNSFVAVGPDAHELLDGHDVTATSFAPMRRLMALGGKMVLVGCVSSSPGFSTVHLAQEDLGLATHTLVRGLFGAYYEQDRVTQWFSRRDVSGCSRGFWKFYSHYVTAKKLRTGWVGDAYSLAIGCREAYDVEFPILARDPRFALCDRPLCVSCRATRMYNLRDIPMFVARLLFARKHGAEPKL